METMPKLIYNGLNMMDEMGVVQITFDTAANRIHVLDKQYVCEPVYDYQKKAYTFSDETLACAKVLFHKKYILTNSINFEEWIKKVDWVFYSNKSVILRYVDARWYEYNWKSQQSFLYKDYQWKHR